MEINGLGHIDGPQPIRAPHRAESAESIEPTNTESISFEDRIEFSTEAEMLSRIDDLPEIRTDRVADIRAQIEAGVYETDEKLEVSIGRLLDEIA